MEDLNNLAAGHIVLSKDVLKYITSKVPKGVEVYERLEGDGKIRNIGLRGDGGTIGQAKYVFDFYPFVSLGLKATAVSTEIDKAIEEAALAIKEEQDRVEKEEATNPNPDEIGRKKES